MSDILELDLSDDLPPEGSYLVKVSGVEQQTSQSGNPMLVWDLVIARGEHAGFSVTMWTALTPAAMWKVREVFRALGFREDKLRVRLAELIGKTMKVTLEHDEYNGSPVVRVAGCEPA